MARLLAATVSAAALAAASGCATHPAPRPAAAPAPAQQLQDADAVITSDSTSMRQSWALFGAQQVLVQQCMARLGYHYLITSAGPEPAADVTTADVDGTASPPSYGVTPGSVAGATPAQDLYVRGLAPAQQARYLTALNGSADQRIALALPSGATVAFGTGGCLGQARDELYGSIQAAMESAAVPQDVQQLLEGFLGSDRSYQTAIGAWQRCMVASGQSARTPAALIGSIQSLASTGVSGKTLAARQSADARDDLVCDARSGLRRTLAQQQAAFLTKQPAATLVLLDRAWQAREQAAARAGAPA
ncbi:hypothetical protein [Streptacidiphilus albus]|uniref:hypothetical protein n=1 Tax=Streptacidiphilus albus TaxID=105425 RepID=UPI00054B4C57|nr:hypothetical protein [Streptacidiphilus albus]